MVYFLTKASSDIIKIAAKSNTLQRVCTMSTQTPKELRIPVPWGHIAAMSWNPDGPTKVLGLHGWLDNAATFNKLAPLLSPSIHLVSVDLPGHGYSSKYPAGVTLNLIDFAYAARRVIDFLQWPNCYVLAHSVCNVVSYMLHGMFPDLVLKIVGIDQINPDPAESASQLVEFRRKAFVDSLKAEQNEEPKPRTLQSLVEALSVQSSMGGMQPESARILLSRGATKVGEDGYVLNRDFRYRDYRNFSYLIPEENRFYASVVRCEVLAFRCDDGLQVYIGPRLFQFKPTNARNFREIVVPGKHHIHLDNPEVIAPAINDFLAISDSSSL